MQDAKETAVGEKGREVMEAFVRAAVHGLVDDDENMHIPVWALHELVGGSKNSVDGAIKHLLENRMLAPMVIDDYDTGGIKDSRNWYAMLVPGAEWLAKEGIVPVELVGAFFPHTIGWAEDVVGHFPNWGEIWQSDLAEWGKDRFPKDEKFVAAKAAFERAMRAPLR